MSEDNLHADILADNIHDAKHSRLVANWAGGKFASSLPILAWPPHFQAVLLGRSTSSLFKRQCYPGPARPGPEPLCLFGRACTCRPVLPLHLVPSCAPISAGLLGLIGCWSSHWYSIMSSTGPTVSITKLRLPTVFHFRMGSHSLPVEQGQACQDIYVAAHCAPVGPWVTQGPLIGSAALHF